MKAAPKPLNEWERLENLRQYDLLDSSPDPALDLLTQLASMICQTPIALISLIDSHRQWFMSRVGLKADQTPRDYAFCAHAILKDEIFEIHDSRADERFSDNPLVIDQPEVVFYSGVPLKTPEGFNIGTLCVIDHKPNVLSLEKRRALSVLGRLTVEQIVARKNKASLEVRIEEIKKLQKDMSQQQALLFQNSKLSSLGEMASGMAHEINNPLTIIRGRLMMLKDQCRDFQDRSALNQNFKIIDTAVERISHIISGLKTFARDGSKDAFENTTVNDLIKTTMVLCETSIKENHIELLLDIPSDPIILQIRKTQISQVLVNLISNAVDAIKQTQYPWIEIKCRQTEDSVDFHVIDSGSGIPLVIQDHIMEPFFTTKSVGQGTGLGLSIAKGIVESHQGTLLLDNESKNTHFVFSLPRAPRSA